MNAHLIWALVFAGLATLNIVCTIKNIVDRLWGHAVTNFLATILCLVCIHMHVGLMNAELKDAQEEKLKVATAVQPQVDTIITTRYDTTYVYHFQTDTHQ